MNADHLHDHHVQPTQREAAAPEAKHAEKASSLATVGIGALVLLALIAATALLLMR